MMAIEVVLCFTQTCSRNKMKINILKRRMCYSLSTGYLYVMIFIHVAAGSSLGGGHIPPGNMFFFCCFFLNRTWTKKLKCHSSCPIRREVFIHENGITEWKQRAFRGSEIEILLSEIQTQSVIFSSVSSGIVGHGWKQSRQCCVTWGVE